MAQTVECLLCPRHCRLKEGERGNCRARMNLKGKLHTLTYGNPSAVHVDPVEKKPFYHVLPGSLAFSIGTAGCNLHCKYCQNWEISQRAPDETENYHLSPEQVVSAALKANSRSIAYTYTEPIIFFEYMTDIAKLSKKQGLRNIVVSAGYIEEIPLLELCSLVDAIKIDFKGITEEFYKNMSSATLTPVQKALITIKKSGVWLEVVNLVVPTWNDSEKDLKELCRWTFENLGPDTPIHFSRFWPMHQLKNLPPTPLETLIQARDIALAQGFHYAYVGNIPHHEGNNTYCPNDKKLLIRREGYMILENNIIDGKCQFCQNPIPGVWT